MKAKHPSEITKRAKSMRSNPTDAEQRLWHAPRRRRFAGYKFRRQYPLGGYIVDFICLERRLVVEVGGSQHHDQSEYDMARDDWLRSQNFGVLRFWNSDVLTALDSVEAAIIEALEGTPLPNPPPQGGRGLRTARASTRQADSAEFVRQREV